MSLKFLKTNKVNVKKNLINRVLKCQHIGKAPKIDGKLDDICWNKRYSINNFKTTSGGKPEVATTAWICIDDNFIYFAFKCIEPQINKISKNHRKRDHKVWQDDCVEIFIDANHDHQSYYHVLVNSLGTIADFKNTKEKADINFNVKNIKAASCIQEGSWSSEIAIPLDSIDLSNTCVAGINLQRIRKVFYSPVALIPSPHKAENYADLILKDMPFEVKQISLLYPLLTGDNKLETSIETKTLHNNIKSLISVGNKNAKSTQKSYEIIVNKESKVNNFLFPLDNLSDTLTLSLKHSKMSSYKLSYPVKVKPLIEMSSGSGYYLKNEKCISLNIKINIRNIENCRINLTLHRSRPKEQITKFGSTLISNDALISIPISKLTAEQQYIFNVSIVKNKKIIGQKSIKFRVIDYNKLP